MEWNGIREYKSWNEIRFYAEHLKYQMYESLGFKFHNMRDFIGDEYIKSVTCKQCFLLREMSECVIWFHYHDTFAKTCLQNSFQSRRVPTVVPLNVSSLESWHSTVKSWSVVRDHESVIIVIKCSISEAPPDFQQSASATRRIWTVEMSKLKRSATISIHTGLRNFIKNYASRIEPKVW